jgi:hypothetical protein
MNMWICLYIYILYEYTFLINKHKLKFWKEKNELQGLWYYYVMLIYSYIYSCVYICKLYANNNCK